MKRLTCKDYIFKLTSGQLKEAGLVDKVRATSHRLVCRHCRAFTRNDARLDAILQNYQAHLAEPDETP
ncbi:hypothetical protein [Aquabacterium sp.]|uniref:hypothetical protein n=1 Tax=Aquabacterium sp. TaxID=1872578 RepID=UPI0035B018A0